MPLLKVEDVAKILNVSKETVRRQIKKGVYQSVRVGRQYRLPSEQFSDLIAAAGLAELEAEIKAHDDDIADLL